MLNSSTSIGIAMIPPPTPNMAPKPPNAAPRQSISAVNVMDIDHSPNVKLCDGNTQACAKSFPPKRLVSLRFIFIPTGEILALKMRQCCQEAARLYAVSPLAHRFDEAPVQRRNAV